MDRAHGGKGMCHRSRGELRMVQSGGGGGEAFQNNKMKANVCL